MQELIEKTTHFRKEFGDLYGVIDLSSLLDKITDKMRQYMNCREAAIFLYNVSAHLGLLRLAKSGTRPRTS